MTACSRMFWGYVPSRSSTGKIAFLMILIEANVIAREDDSAFNHDLDHF
jgi:hypothetical protein